MGDKFLPEPIYAVAPTDTWSSMSGFDERNLPGRTARPRKAFRFREDASQTTQLLDLIGYAEAGSAGYDAVHLSAQIAPPAPPTKLTVGEIFEWIDQTPGQHHAIGRYQFIPSTLARLVREAGVSPDARFTPALQDKLAGRLFVEAGYGRFLSGDLGRSEFMDELAGVWAGLPLGSGRSVYHGTAGNRATISRAEFTRIMGAIFGKLGVGA